MKFDSFIEEHFYRRFNALKVKYYTSKEYEIKAIRPLRKNVPYDISINIGSRILAIIEFKGGQYLEVFDYSRIERYASENNIRLFILSDGEKFIVNDRRNPNRKSTVNFDDLIQILNEREEINVKELKPRIAEVIKNLIIQSEFRFLKARLESLSNQIVNAIDYNEIDQMFSFKNPSDIENIENRIFRLLLKDEKPLNKIYHSQHVICDVKLQFVSNELFGWYE